MWTRRRGRRLAARGAVRGEMQLVRLDEVLGLAAAAIEHFVEPAGRAGEVGHDKARVAALPLPSRRVGPRCGRRRGVPCLSNSWWRRESRGSTGFCRRPPRRDGRPRPRRVRLCDRAACGCCRQGRLVHLRRLGPCKARGGPPRSPAASPCTPPSSVRDPLNGSTIAARREKSIEPRTTSSPTRVQSNRASTSATRRGNACFVLGGVAAATVRAGR